jgi:hypothetical protein
LCLHAQNPKLEPLNTSTNHSKVNSPSSRGLYNEGLCRFTRWLFPVLADNYVGMGLFLAGLGMVSVVGLEKLFVASAVLSIDHLINRLIVVV